MWQSVKVWEKSLSKLTLSSGGGGWSVEQEIYEIFVFVPFILSKIVGTERAHNLMVCNLRLKIKGSQFERGC